MEYSISDQLVPLMEVQNFMTSIQIEMAPVMVELDELKQMLLSLSEKKDSWLEDLEMQNESKQDHYLSESTQLEESSASKQSIETQQSITQLSLSRRQSNRPHLTRDRKKRGQKCSLQRSFKGYWTKNYLQFGKNSHFKWIDKKMGVEFVQNDERLKQIREKNGIAMEDYLYLYRIPQLKQVWTLFFRNKVLYRELPLSRAEQKSKIVFLKFLYRFEEAFITAEFDHIA